MYAVYLYSVLLAGTASLTSGGHSYQRPSGSPVVGRCTVDVKTDRTLDYGRFMCQNSYFLSIVAGPYTPFTAELEWMHIYVAPLPNKALWNDTVLYKNKLGEIGVYIKELIFNENNGMITTYSTGGNHYNVFILYSTFNLLFCYICSDDFPKSDIDYRWVLSSKPLTKKDIEMTIYYDKLYGFKGSLATFSTNFNRQNLLQDNYIENYCPTN